MAYEELVGNRTNVRGLLGSPFIPPDAFAVMLHGRSVPSVPVFYFGEEGSDWESYNWAKKLAQAQIAPFAMDSFGFGKSPRPAEMGDKLNVSLDQRPTVYPLVGRRSVNGRFMGSGVPDDPHPYPHYLGDTDYDVQDLLNVLAWIQKTYAARPIHLVGYSAAAFTLGRFLIAGFPRMVQSLFLAAPVFPPFGLSLGPREEGGPDPDAFASPRVPGPGGRLQDSKEPTLFGYPMFAEGYWDMLNAWELDEKQGAKRQTGIERELWKSIMAQDPVGASWNPSITDDPDTGGVLRYPNVLRFGWSTSEVKKSRLGFEVPVAIVHGTSDTQINLAPNPMRQLPTFEKSLDPAPGPPFSAQWLYASIPGPNKIIVSIDDTGHFMPWEKRAEVLHSFSIEWIRDRKIRGHPWGQWHLTSSGAFEDVS